MDLDKQLTNSPRQDSGNQRQRISFPGTPGEQQRFQEAIEDHKTTASKPVETDNNQGATQQEDLPIGLPFPAPSPNVTENIPATAAADQVNSAASQDSITVLPLESLVFVSERQTGDEQPVESRQDAELQHLTGRQPQKQVASILGSPILETPKLVPEEFDYRKQSSESTMDNVTEKAVPASVQEIPALSASQQSLSPKENIISKTIQEMVTAPSTSGSPPLPSVMAVRELQVPQDGPVILVQNAQPPQSISTLDEKVIPTNRSEYFFNDNQHVHEDQYGHDTTNIDTSLEDPGHNSLGITARASSMQLKGEQDSGLGTNDEPQDKRKENTSCQGSNEWTVDPSYNIQEADHDVPTTQHVDLSDKDMHNLEDKRDGYDSKEPTAQRSLEEEFFSSVAGKNTLSGHKSNIRDLGIVFNNKMRLRQPQHQRGFGTAWQDLDDSGTYDPKIEQRLLRKKARNVRTELDEKSTGRKHDRHGTDSGSMMPFKLAGSNGLDYLRSITPGPGIGSSLMEVDESILGPQAKQPRRPSKIGRAEESILLNLTPEAPQRQGCKACVERNDDNCSLIHDGTCYPCNSCHDTGEPCILIIQPEYKRICECCKRKKILCSYRLDHGKNARSCEQCLEDGEECVAGPLRRSIVPKSKKETAGQRRPRQESYQAQVKRQIKTRALGSRMKRQRRRKSESPFGSYPRRRHISTGNSHQKCKKPRKTYRQAPKRSSFSGEEHLTRSSSPQLFGMTAEGKPTKLIKTSFCYPLTFNALPKAGSMLVLPCDFCDNALFGMCGYGEVEVELADHEVSSKDLDGEMITKTITEEISGGHYENGKDPTNMCIACTMARVRIISCLCHQMVPIRGLDPKTFDYGALKADLQSQAECSSLLDSHNGNPTFSEIIAEAKTKQAAKRIHIDTHWCSICPSPAFFICSTSEDGTHDSFEGCGLTLCEICNDLLHKLQNSPPATLFTVNVAANHRPTTIDQMVQIASAGSMGEWENGLRADVKFLTTEGDLVAFLAQECEEEDERVRRQQIRNSPIMDEDVFVPQARKESARQQAGISERDTVSKPAIRKRDPHATMVFNGAPTEYNTIDLTKDDDNNIVDLTRRYRSVQQSSVSVQENNRDGSLQNSDIVSERKRKRRKGKEKATTGDNIQTQVHAVETIDLTHDSESESDFDSDSNFDFDSDSDSSDDF
ncbi:hypothetical protein BP6252_03546 [Coleophoma cylindrospora]|uniref:Zn(2)-C6 fungal-type domain-containing protein n=1 Tax=Coleophoma cylindrospora TaxID=1849047 RepID=A0A3D8S8K9_9HELO|nr:hypothetical protein BP6252_03546 [Coleophoma cylindrospora]